MRLAVAGLALAFATTPGFADRAGEATLEARIAVLEARIAALESASAADAAESEPMERVGVLAERAMRRLLRLVHGPRGEPDRGAPDAEVK